jgi:CHAT domain-containing protein
VGTQSRPPERRNFLALLISNRSTEVKLGFLCKGGNMFDTMRLRKSHILVFLVIMSLLTSDLDPATRGAAIAERGGDLGRLSELHHGVRTAYRGLNKPEQARRSFAGAIAAIEELCGNLGGDTEQEQRLFEQQVATYYRMVSLLIGQQKLMEAFAYAERSKGQALLDTLHSGRLNITHAMTPDEREEERKLNGEVNSLNIQIARERARDRPDEARLVDLDARLTNARLDQERFRINFYAAHPELKVQRGQLQLPSVDQAAKLIPDPNTALLEYVVTEEKTHLFVLTKRQPLCPAIRGDSSRSAVALNVYTLDIKQKDLAARVESFRSRLASLVLLSQAPARDLYDLLLGGARAELQNKTNLIIVPDGVLWELPFQALQPAPQRFLIEDSAISYAPSLTVLLEMARARKGVPTGSLTLLALGNPTLAKATTEKSSVFRDERPQPLPDAEREVRMLARIYGPSRSKVYIGPEAQEAKAKKEAPGYGILHLAAHGVLNDENPMYSHLVLSQPEGDTNEDGLLEAWEVMRLDLNADLVVLSACETARGRIRNGEGMIGLAWAFFVAGAPTTVASQWKVETKSTAELMVEFHRNLERHKSKAESLRQAMLRLLRTKEYNRPFYWAGFVLVGNGR